MCLDRIMSTLKENVINVRQTLLIWIIFLRTLLSINLSRPRNTWRHSYYSHPTFREPAELIWNRLNLIRTGDGSSLMMVGSSCRTFYISSIIGQTDIRQGQIFFRLRFMEIFDLIIIDHFHPNIFLFPRFMRLFFILFDS